MILGNSLSFRVENWTTFDTMSKDDTKSNHRLNR